LSLVVREWTIQEKNARKSSFSALLSNGTSVYGVSKTSSPTSRALLPPPGSPDVLYLVDLSGYVFRAYHAISPLSNSKGEVTHAVMGTVNMLQKIVGERRPAMLAVAMDSGSPSFRKQIDARYKATRPPAPPDLSQQIVRCEQIVRAYNIPVYRADAMEADDLIAAVVGRAVREGLVVVIVSADKDLMQLVRDTDERVLVWDSMRDRTYGPVEVEEKFGVPPSQLGDLLALTGDTSDNIPGVPSVGPKTAADLLREHGSFDGIYRHIDSIKRPKLRAMLEAHEADARVSRELVTLKADVPIEWNRDHLQYGGADVAGLRKLFVELEFTRLLDRIGATQATESVAPSQQAPAALPTVHAARYALTTAEVSRVLAVATARGALGISVVGSSPDPMRADIIGVGLSAGDGEATYVPIQHRYLGAPAQLRWSDLSRVLAPTMADPNVRKVTYDIKRAQNILFCHGLRIEGKVSDPLLAAYLLDPESPNGLQDLVRREFGTELAVYDEAATAKKKSDRVAFDQLDIDRATSFGAAPAAIALSLAVRLDARLGAEGLGSLYEDLELPLSRVLSMMEQKGVLVDTSKLAAIAVQVDAECAALEEKAHECIGHKFAIRSRDQLETILFDELELPVVKRTAKGGRSTDAAVLDELADKHPLPQVILDYRELDKLKGTYLEGLPRAVNPATGRIHTRFEQAVTATGRLSSTEPNLQNIPVRSNVGRLVRSAFVAPDGFVIVSADYSQIELRVLAHLAKDEELARAFRDKLDVHAHTASLVFDVPRSEVTSEMRRRAKAINFGLIYGMGESRLARELGISRPDAARFIEAYFKRFVGVRNFMARTVEKARSGEAVRTILGRRRFLPNLHSGNRGLRFEAERVAKNTPIQGTAADILKLAMIKLGAGDVVPGARMILTVHDELVFEVPEGLFDEAASRIKEAMETALVLDVPLVVDIGQGKNWGAAH